MLEEEQNFFIKNKKQGEQIKTLSERSDLQEQQIKQILLRLDVLENINLKNFNKGDRQKNKSKFQQLREQDPLIRIHNIRAGELVSTYDSSLDVECITLEQETELEMREYIENFQKVLNSLNNEINSINPYFELIKNKVDKYDQNVVQIKEILSKFEKIENKTTVEGIYIDEKAQKILQEIYLINLQKLQSPENQSEQNQSPEKSQQTLISSLMENVVNLFQKKPNQQKVEIPQQIKQNEESQVQEQQKQDKIQIENDEIQSEGEENNQQINQEQSHEENDTSSLKQSGQQKQSLNQSHNHLSQLQISVQSQIRQLKIQYYPKNHPNPEREKVVFTLINELYNQSWRKRYAERNFQYFIRDKQPLNELYKNYGIRSSQMKSQLSQICNSFRQARGDGNCFYTAFGVQFFSLILNQYTEQQFNEFIEKMDKIITFNIKLKQQQLEIRDEQTYQLMWQEFKYRLQFLRNIKEVDFREQELINHYAAFEEGSAIDQSLIDGCFYGLATIFLRNLAYYLIQQSEFKDQVFDKYNLLIWEEECNNNEIIILELSKFLQVNIKLLFFDNGSFTLREYSQGLRNQIILLIRPGHYNVGYFEQDNKY